MSPVPLADGANVVVGSLAAILSSIGAAGLSSGTSTAIEQVGAIVSSISAAALLCQKRGDNLCRTCEGVLQRPDLPWINPLDFQLLLSVEADDLFDMEVLLQAGADAHVLDIEGATLLHLASARNCVRTIPRLIVEMNIDVRDNNGCTALFYAAANKCEEAKQVLLESGASRDCIPQN